MRFATSVIFFEGVLEAFRNMGRDSYSISTAHLRFARIYELMSHPAILDPVSDLLGENLAGWGAHFFCKLPHDGKSGALASGLRSIGRSLRPETVTVWLSIDDADPENANMRFIPRSHLHGTIDYQLKDNPNAVLNLETKDPENHGDPPVDVSLKAGQFSMHCDLLLHGSEPKRIRSTTLRTHPALRRDRSESLLRLAPQGYLGPRPRRVRELGESCGPAIDPVLTIPFFHRLKTFG